MSQSTDKQKISKSNNETEVVLTGRAVSRGVGIGKVLCLYGKKRQFYKVNLERRDVDREVRRFLAAIRLATRQLEKISQGGYASVGENQASIFETHLLFLDDKSLLKNIENTIRGEKVNAEWAVKIVTDSYISRYKILSDKHLREKYIDLEDVTERLLTALGGGKRSTVEIDKDTIIVAKELKPSTLIELNEQKPKAIITENGGWTSHTFILARELRLPAVTGLRGILRRLNTGEEVIVNGYAGQVTLRASDESKDNLTIAESEFQDLSKEEFEFESANPKTLDGIEVIIRANLDMSGDYAKARRYGAKGIGLYRSEFLFNQNRGFPAEKEQIASYRRVAAGGDAR